MNDNDRGAAAASHTVTEAGIRKGNVEIIRPMNEMMKSPTALLKAAVGCRPDRPRQHARKRAAVTRGTGHRYNRPGAENQRWAIRSSWSGVQTLTIRMNTPSANSSG